VILTDYERSGIRPEPAGGQREFRTGAWHGEEALSLLFPETWDVTVLWPQTPPALTDSEIAESLERPVGQPPIRELCRGKSRPLIIVDDLNRPTPVGRVMPLVLAHFRQAGIPAQAVRILLATGTHGAPEADSVRKKVGPEAASACQILVHDASRNCAPAGRTAFGTPVLVDKSVLASDFVMGIGGVYPNFTAGFGGGSKLALGVLGYRSIKNLHFRHAGVGWGRHETADPLRTDLNEIAKMIGLDTIISLQINATREVIRATCGDHLLYYGDEVAFARRYFTAPPPDGADVVVSNAYPSDLSLTAVHQKGTAPLQQAGSAASRIVLASCTEGIGHHGLFPVANRPRFFGTLQITRQISTMKPRELAASLARRLRRGLRSSSPENARPKWQHAIWLYQPGHRSGGLPTNIPGYRLAHSWANVLRAVQAEQGGRPHLKVFVYPCAPLQRIERINQPRT
jgi:nickel-dependent lactate racemase